MKTYKWQNRERKRSKRNKMIGGKLDTGIMQAQSTRIPNAVKNIFYCKNCKDMKRFKGGKCRKCGNRLDNN